MCVYIHHINRFLYILLYIYINIDIYIYIHQINTYIYILSLVVVLLLLIYIYIWEYLGRCRLRHHEMTWLVPRHSTWDPNTRAGIRTLRLNLFV